MSVMPDGWQPAATPPALQEDEVHIWRIRLDLAPPFVAALYGVLVADELARVARHRSGDVRRRFIVARGALRSILSAYLGAGPQQVPIGYTCYGKPILMATAELRGLACSFNLSHAGELALVALSRGREVGVDLEQLRPELATAEIATRFFSPAESATLAALPGEERVRAFFACWTRKEAYLKARGEGHARPLDGFTVSVASDRPAQLLSGCEAGDAARWALVDLDPGPGYVGAVAAFGHGWRPVCRQWIGSPQLVGA
ncbi:MAG TPA: 4'-phosphopantetheinyl transferase superfamily protein [Anaerolineae bacterium]|nr:4'-phosphopantetheinyl transferase superfamily protein [Anaerolineae bacterium]HOR00997.1 4'-phosphopantetheinyl transferase superfamily protein [Anaerolineae bacterium]HPL28583.1 4'-phosphopantetheinyl transferase superfamily protein [Anaerolineae bacterium]